SVPGFLLPGRHGVIRGHVFRDDASTARYTGKETPVAGVEIRLDDNQTTHSDANGYYSFHHVPFGMHRVEAKFASPEVFFYTTDSPAMVDMNGAADFGINFAKGQVFGFLLNDGGKGVPGVTVELQGTNGPRTAHTASDGKFRFLGLDPGDYSVRTLPESYPPGYGLQDLQTRAVTVTQGGPSKLDFTVHAFRTVTGKIMAYDTSLLKPVPLPDTVVRLKELSLETRTGSNGAYVFRNLPPGVYTISVQYKGKETVRQVTVPADPANIRDIDLDTGPQ
ncbi:MAG TPA: carboxypeptidase regulatory-like domain-containing protein, partial [Candidatus Angelobacter sp.]|nr:carboxypeptidase regulatory-like domain-containing protein [Candidatus Angelobacter sp.]